MFLMVFVTMWTTKQESTEPHEAMPQVCHICYLRAEQPAAQRTIAHLYAEQIAVPIYASGEIPGYHPHHSKPKCLHTPHKQSRFDARAALADKSVHHSIPIHHHVIDYYIYTLEHILI